MDSPPVQERQNFMGKVSTQQEVAGPDGFDRLPIVVWALFLCVLPLFPSQDGPFHLHHGSTLLAWILGDPSARALFQLQDGLFTNWTTAVVLGDLQVLLGLSPAWAERIWLTLLVAVWVDAFARLRAQLGTSRLVPWFVLLLFQGRIAHLGFWNFLLTTGLALWAWSREGHVQTGRAWRPSVLGAVAILIALCSHPFGGMLYVALVTSEGFLTGRKEGWRRVPWLLPYGLLTAMVLPRIDGSGSRIPFPAWPDILGRELGPWLEVWRPEALPRLGLLMLLVLWSYVCWPTGRARGGFQGRRRATLVLATLGAVALSSLGPEILGTGSQLRARFTLLAWACGLLALPLAVPRRGGNVSRLATGLPLLAALALAATLVPAAVHSFTVARGQAALLKHLPPLARGQWVVASRDAEGLGAFQWYYEPGRHLGERWIAEYRAFNPLSYPMHTDHFPLVARQGVVPPALLDCLKWRPFQVPWEALAEDLDAFLVLVPPADIDQGLIPRLAASWQATEVAGEGAVASSTAVVFVSRHARPLEERRPEEWPTDPLAQPKGIPLDSRMPRQGLVIPVGAGYAHWRWRAFLWQEGVPPVPADERWIEPTAGRFDSRGVLEIERWTPPDPPRFLVLMPG